MKFEQFRSDCHSTNENSNLNFPLQHSFLLHSNDETEISIQLFNILNGKKITLETSIEHHHRSAQVKNTIFTTDNHYFQVRITFDVESLVWYFFIEPKLMK